MVHLPWTDVDLESFVLHVRNSSRDGEEYRTKNGFFDPRLGVVFIHSAGDSRDDGTIWVYRYRRAPR